MNHKEQLLQKIASKQASVGVIGLGYVGLPLALLFEESGYPVIGFDIDPKKPEALHRGESYIKHIGPHRVAGAFARGRIQATSDFDRLAGCDAILICVPTPLGKHRDPDLRLESVPSTADGLRKYDALLVSTAHRESRGSALFAKTRLVVDARNIFPTGTIVCPAVRA